MQAPATPRPATPRDLLYLATTALWPVWPFLPVIRRSPSGEEECGVLFHCWTVARRPGFSATVFLCNIYLMPRGEDEFLALPKEVFDSAEEIAAAGWRID